MDSALSGGEFVAHATGVTRPAAIRYAWRADPVAVLFNCEGFPAAPFFRSAHPAATADSRS